MPKRYFLEIAYWGKNYRGWQVQTDKATVQLEVANTLTTILNKPTKILGCGRTDAGVHASQFFLHFDGEPPFPDSFIHRLNKMLPKDISVKRLLDVPADAHARFDATYRAYDYYMHFQKNPFNYGQSCFFPWLPLDIDTMEKAFNLLPNYNDFVMFCKTGGNNKTTLCDVFKTEMIYDETAGTLQFHIAANRFLRGMVRRIVGVMAMVGKGKISLEEFEVVMETQGKFKYNLSAPPQGLYLSEVRYPYIK